MTTCPKCLRPVLRVDEHPSTRVFVHATAGKDGQAVYGCAVSTVQRKERAA
jgi:hypothetical protein